MDRPAAFEPGERVKLQGLATRPELNGSVAVVLEPSGEAEAANLLESGRVKVSNYPKALSLRCEKLAAAPAPDFCGNAPFTVLEIVRREPRVTAICEAANAAGEDLGMLGSVASCDDPLDFAEGLFQVFGRGHIEPAERLPDDFASIILDTPGHWLYWIGLEQVGHHVIFEACDGVWRGFQASALSASPPPQETPPPPTEAQAPEAAVPRRFEAFGGVLLEGRGGGGEGGLAARPRRPRGFTAQAWAAEGGAAAAAAACTAEDDDDGADVEDLTVHAARGPLIEDDVGPDEILPGAGAGESGPHGGEGGAPTEEGATAAKEEGTSARALWGGGRELKRLEAKEVLNLVSILRDQAQTVAEKLKEQVGDAVDPAEWARERLEAAASATKNTADADCVGGCAGAPGGMVVTPSRPSTPRSAPGYAESDQVWIFTAEGVKPQCDLSLPSATAFSFMRTFNRLVGEYPTGRAFLHCLELCAWEGLEREDGGRVGWTLRALDLRKPPAG